MMNSFTLTVLMNIFRSLLSSLIQSCQRLSERAELSVSCNYITSQARAIADFDRRDPFFDVELEFLHILPKDGDDSRVRAPLSNFSEFWIFVSDR